MNTLILGTAIRLLIPVFQLFSLYILFRGHNHPGGGFIGGLVGSIAFIFYGMAYGSKHGIHAFFNVWFFIENKADYRRRTRLYYHSRRRNALISRTTGRREKWQKRVYRLEPMYLIGLGLLLATSSGLFGMLVQGPYMSALWMDFYLPLLGRPGTPILFDVGVYLLVMGVVMKITFIMSEE
jgi:multicomponent Na+:H+ antiporter subunit B